MTHIITTYRPDDYDAYGQYMIEPNHIHIFPIVIPLFGNVEFAVAHILPNSQDTSIRTWITETPLDGIVLEHQYGRKSLIRRVEKFVIYDKFLDDDSDDDKMFLPSGKTYYINVKNLQNQKNAYQLEFIDNS